MNLEELKIKAKQFEIDQNYVSNQELARKAFIEKFPIEKIIDLTLEEFTLGNGKDTFSYWLEFKKFENEILLFGIGGGSSLKHGIYKSENNKYFIDNKKTNITIEELNNHFNLLKASIVKAINLVKENKISEIKNIESIVFPMVLQKILTIYFPDKFLTVSAKESLLNLANDLKIDNIDFKSDSLIEINYKCREKLNSIDVFKDWNYLKLGKFIWDNYKISNRKEKENEMDRINSYKKNSSLNTILYGPPGTGKTYNTINKAIEIIDPSFDLTQSREIIKSTFDSLVEEGRIVFTTFHQSMSYEDFVEGIKPKVLEGDNSSITYEIESGIFKRIASYNPLPFTTSEIIDKYEILSVSKDVLTLKKPNGNYLPFTFSILYKLLEYLDYKEIDLDSFDGKIKLEDNESKLYPELEPYIINGYPNIIPKILKKLKENKINREKPLVLIIDEINRGNVSQIFGELITLIEEDKRLGNKESLEVTLPYSKEKFGVPSNLYIIGTMNTADRSVEALDTALRRRFTFEEMPPRYDLPELEIEIEGIKLSDLLKIINSRIEKLLDKDHLIGHSFFINVKTLEDLQNTFYKNIIPLLQEYFFGDYGKIGLILGKGFVSKKSNDNIFSDFDYDDIDNLNEKIIYEIIDHRKNDIASFKDAIKNLVK